MAVGAAYKRHGRPACVAEHGRALPGGHDADPRDRDAIDIFILFPQGRVSPVQQRQMTTVASGNVHCIAVDGTFDDCQDLVKALFADTGFRDEVNLSAVNSINWARVMAQTVYYAFAALQLGAPDRSIDVAVPTGNFGNIFAAYGVK